MFPSELLPSVLESAPDAMVVIDSSGTVLFANQQVRALFGFAPADLIGQPVEVLLPQRFRGRHVKHRQSFRENLRLRPMGIGQDLYALRRDGSEFPVEISLSPIRGADQMFVAAAIRDVTDRKNADIAIQAARTEADRANMAKSRFLATASHDLRQPLQALALLNGSLRRTVHDEDAREALDQQDQAIGAMSRLLNALLDISKMESGAVQVQITDFDVAPLLQEMQVEFSSLAFSKQLRLELHLEHAGLRSDRTLIAQVLRNLISNALKYTDRGSIRIACRRQDANVCIDVTDSGIGICSDDLPFIFDEFYQVGVSTHSSREGYGLGLSIVQRVMRLLGLVVTVKSELGSGSTFSIHIPAATAGTVADTAPLARVPGPITGGRHRHILLVEDDAGVRKATRLFLKGEGYEVTAAASLAEALALTASLTTLELIITDYHLGGGERGTDVITALQTRFGARINAILITGDTSSAIGELPRDLQLQIISKPVDPDELLTLMRTLLPDAAADTT
ncbi:MAG: ATP-binding protein [Pseudomonadota bacterium]